MTTYIPTYAFDGERLRDHTVGSIERLLALSRIVVTRNRKGQIVCARYRHANGAHPLRRSPRAGQRYSFHGQIGKVKLWQHKQLPRLSRQDLVTLLGESATESETRAARERFLQGIFFAVPLSVLLSPYDGRPLPPSNIAGNRGNNRKVISIDEGRRAA